MDKETLLKMSVEERLTAVHQMDAEILSELVAGDDGDILISQVGDDIKANPELVKKLRGEV